MSLKNRKGLALVIVVALAAALSFGYYLYQLNTDSQDTISTQNVPSETENNQVAGPDKQENSQETESNTPAGTVITTGESEFGTILFDKAGQAIYIWELEESSEAECYGNCAEAWPPVLTNGMPQAMGGVNSDLLGTTTRTDGSTQVTYNGHPLYYYAHEGPGEVKCHNVSTHGGLWWVIHPSGNRAE